MVVSEIGAADAVRDQLVDVIAALPVALGAFDAEHVELALNVAEDEVTAGHGAMFSRFPLRGGQLGAVDRFPPSTRRETYGVQRSVQVS